MSDFNSLIHTIEKPEKHIFIYGLIDPRDGLLKYIGLATNGFNRMKQHYSSCYVGKTQSRLSPVKCWIKSLKTKGLIFQPVYLEYFDNDDRQIDEAECFYIDYFKFLGCNLLNFESGGRRDFNKRNMSEDRKKHTERLKEIHGTEEKRAFFSQKTKEQWKNPEIRKRMSENNRKPKSKQGVLNMIKGNIQRFILQDQNGIVYDSIQDASRKLKIGAMCIHRALKFNKEVQGYRFTRLNNVS